MYKALLYICIFLPILGGALVPLIGFKERRTREPYVLAVVIATSAISVFLSLKGVGTAARKEIEALLGCRVNLKTWVKIKENWRDSDIALSNFGYYDN